MKKQTVKFEKVGFREYRTTDGIFEIKSYSYDKYRIYKNGKYIAMALTVNEAKSIIRTHVELYM